MTSTQISMPQPKIKFRFNHSINSWQMLGFFAGEIPRIYRWIAVSISCVQEFLDAHRGEIIVEDTAPSIPRNQWK